MPSVIPDVSALPAKDGVSVLGVERHEGWEPFGYDLVIVVFHLPQDYIERLVKFWGALF